ncbi:MAG TPA: alpha-E domain-containing protein [Polyangiaceae bacterium]
MLLSSVAETMFWSGRYMERAQALARAIQALEQLSLDLPARRSIGLKPLLTLVNPNGVPVVDEASQWSMLHALALDTNDASSVLGALAAARENVRQARVVVPPELWVALNHQYQLLKAVEQQPVARVVEALGAVVEAGRRIEGELESGMARDAAHAFLSIGIRLERADMMLRILGALLPAVTMDGWERAFDDVRWGGLLRALGVHSMYRRRHHHQLELPTLLEFLMVDLASPRSVVHCLREVEEELAKLPRAARVRATVSVALSRAFALAHAAPDQLEQQREATLVAISAVHDALQSCYFPEHAPSLESESAQPAAEIADPFEYLTLEHHRVESVLRLLDELAAQTSRGQDVDKAEILAAISFFTEFGELGHHEKEESILTPVLVENGFDWSEGPVAAMRREHRHEHAFVRAILQLANQRPTWSSEDRRRFVTEAHEFAHFLRSHMDHERRDLFEQAARSLPEQTKRRLAHAFADFDAKQHSGITAASPKLDALLRKYGVHSPPA